MRMLWTLLIGYALVVLVVAIFQRRLIYFPAKFSPTVAEQLATENGFLPWHNRAGQIIGWKIPSIGTSEGSVLVTHGNAGSATGRSYLAKPIHDALPMDVYVLEYPGYGAREGSPSLKSFLAAGDEALDALPKELPVYLVSESIGAGVAAHLAKMQPSRIKGMAMFVPYDDLASVGQSSMPFLPVKLVMLDRFQPAHWLEDFCGPVKVVLAGADEVIPTKFGQRLFDGYRGTKELQIVPGAHHNEVAERSPDWWKETATFWRWNADAK